MTPTELRERRLALGLGTPRMARVLGCTPSHYRHMESGSRAITAPVALAVSLLTPDNLPEAAQKKPSVRRKSA